MTQADESHQAAPEKHSEALRITGKTADFQSIEFMVGMASCAADLTNIDVRLPLPCLFSAPLLKATPGVCKVVLKQEIIMLPADVQGQDRYCGFLPR